MSEQPDTAIAFAPTPLRQRVRRMAHADFAALPGYSPSQWRKYRACPAAWVAEYVARTYQPEPSTSMAVGTYRHALLLDPMAAPAILAESGTGKSGKPLVDFARAEQDADFARRQGWLAALLADADTATEVPVWGEIGEPPLAWRARVDILHATAGVWDIKTAGRGWADVWEPSNVPGERGRFVLWYAAAEWWAQLAVCRELAAQMGYVAADCPVGIIGIRPATGDRLPDVRIVAARGWDYGMGVALDQVADDAAGMAALTGEYADVPRACGDCDYCLSQKHNAAPVWLA